ncbi:hypothetical protein [Oenococcus oeni]|uniref:hypothetical protein n=1 Tax=Oenococcus oeni TaxID=1247 RepID=UPI000B1DAB79|nr:hypothetical protein [Oenococcus oeni]
MKRAIKKAAYFSLSSLAVSTLALVLPAINSNTVASAKPRHRSRTSDSCAEASQ